MVTIILKPKLSLEGSLNTPTPKGARKDRGEKSLFTPCSALPDTVLLPLDLWHLESTRQPPKFSSPGSQLCSVTAASGPQPSPGIHRGDWGVS